MYATSCSLMSSYDYMWKQVTFTCGSISKTYVNPNYNSTCSKLSTATYAAPGTPSINIAWAWNQNSMFVTNFGPGYNAMLNFGCNQNYGWQYFAGFGAKAEPICGNYNHYYSMPKCYSFSTRNYVMLVKQQPGQSITQLGLVCGQWNTTQ